jgi:hypothetical protein
MRASGWELNGQIVKRQKVEVLMDFLTEEGCTQISSRLKEGYEMITPKQVRAHVYCIDAEKMCFYLTLKHAETAQHWVNNSVDVPALLEVEHGCAH